jgi:hypothetical protein
MFAQEKSSRRSPVAGRTSKIGGSAAWVFAAAGLMVSLLIADAAVAQTPAEDEMLAATKKYLGPGSTTSPEATQKRREMAWYVILLRERTALEISVRYVKVQSQDAAAKEVYEFLSAPTGGRKDIAGKWFPGNKKGEAGATAFYQQQLNAGVASVLARGAFFTLQ